VTIEKIRANLLGRAREQRQWRNHEDATDQVVEGLHAASLQMFAQGSLLYLKSVVCLNHSSLNLTATGLVANPRHEI